MHVFSKLLPNTTRHWIFSGMGLLALIVFGGLIMVKTAEAEVTVADNGDEQTIQTHADTVRELLDEAGINYSAHDDLSPHLDAPIEDGMTIEYDAAKKLTVEIDDEDNVYHTTAATINEFLDDHDDISVHKHDETSHPDSAAITDGMVYSVEKAFDITVNDAGEKQDVTLTTSQKVEEILDDNDIELGDLDQVEPALDDAVEKGDDITITRVETSKETEDEPIEYDTKKRKDDSLEKGETKVIQEGKDGTLAKIYKVRTENGEDVNRKLVEEEVTQESENKIVAHGTKEQDSDSDQKVTKVSAENDDDDNQQENDNQKDDKQKANNHASSKKELQMNATAYTANCAGCDGSGDTASGINLYDNPQVVSVDPDVIPLGSRVWVEGYGNAVAGDTGGDIQGNRIDLHFPSKDQAREFGRQTVKVKVLD